MKLWTAHEKPDAQPVLVREGFSFGALIFGPFWLAAHRAWVAAGVTIVLAILIGLLTRPPASVAILLGLAFVLGCSARDIVRWTIARRGYLESNVVSGRDEDEARARLLNARPDLVHRSLIAETAPH